MSWKSLNEKIDEKLGPYTPECFALIFFGGAYFEFDHSHALVAVVAATIGVALLFLGPRRRRYLLGWFIDARGERQKIEKKSGDIVTYYPTSHAQRVVEEVERRSRRKYPLFGLGAWYALQLCCYLGWGLEHPPFLPSILMWFGAVSAPVGVPAFLIFLGIEIAYRLEYQDMKGAMVLDPEPNPPGLDQVHKQKAHGDARFASPHEALNRLKRGA